MTAIPMRVLPLIRHLFARPKAAPVDRAYGAIRDRVKGPSASQQRTFLSRPHLLRASDVRWEILIRSLVEFGIGAK